MFKAQYWLNKFDEDPASVVLNRTPHSYLDRVTEDRDEAEADFRNHARHIAWSRNHPVVWRMDGDTGFRQTPVPDNYPQ